MSEESTAVVNNAPLYPQDKLVIKATYRDDKGSPLPVGMPEVVEIELNELPGELMPFLTDLVASLFRYAPPAYAVEVEHNGPPVPFDPAVMDRAGRAEVAAP